MPQFNFQRRFAALVEAGTKCQTVRATRKSTPRTGQVAHCFEGMRQPGCRKLGAWPIEHVETIEIHTDGTIWLGTPDCLLPLIDDPDAFAQADGFANAAELVGWIARTHGLPFEGTVTYW